MSIYDVTGENGSSPAAAKPGGDGGSLMDEMLVEGSRPKGAGIAGKCHQAEQGVLYLAERYKALPRPQQVLVAVGFIILVAVVVFFASGDEEEIEELFEPAKKLGKVSGRFVAAKHAMTWTEARTFCTGNVDGIQLHGLASVHSFREQRQLVSACKDMDLSHSWIPHDPMTPKPHGCWIGLNDYSMEGGFTWTDGSAVDYVNWYSGEPNDYGGDAASTSGSYGPNGAGAGHTTYTQGEDHVSINFVTGHGGSWNDEANTGPCAHNENVVCGNYPVCQTTPGPPVSDADSSVVGCMLPLCWRTLFDPPQSGRFVAIAKQFGYFAADKECRDAGYQGLASIHSLEDLQDATQACEQLATTERGTGLPHGCWIGLNDHQAEGQFAWQDGTAVDFMNWGTGEPNSYKGSDEDGVAMDFRNTVSSGQGQTGGGALTGGAWADVHLQGQGGRVGAIKQLGTGQCWGCYGNYGNFPLCQVSRPVCDNDGSGPWTYNMVSTVTKGRFIALHRASSWTEAKQYCEREFEGLASIHTQGESRAVIQACRRIAGLVDGAPGGCWIGLHDSPSLGATPGQFEWTDNSPVNYVNWSPGEPNNWGIDTHVGHASSAGEEAVQVNMAHNHGGGWNDAHIDGIVGHRGNGANGAATGHSTSCFGCAGTYGMYAVCQTRAPDPSSWANSHYLPIGQQVSNVNSWLAPTAAERTTGVLSTTAFGGPGKFIIYPQAMTWEAARAKCRNGGAPNNLPGVLASIHTQAEQDEVVALCRRFAAKVDGQPSGCWIGFGDRTDESTFVWSDNTPIDYLGWNTNEPSNHRGGAARISGEDMVAVELRGTWEGKWNDAHTLGRAHGVEACGCFGCYGAMGNYPICMLPPPPPTPPPLGVPPPPPRVCTVADDAMRGCYGRADGSDRPNHQPCCEVPPAITGCASLTSAAPDPTLILSLEAACPGPDPTSAWWSTASEPGVSIVMETPVVDQHQTDGRSINTTGLTYTSFSSAHYPPIAASFGFNGQVSKLLSLDISPSMIPSLTIEVWFKMNEQLTDPSRSGLSHNWIIGQAFRHNGPWGNAPAALARSRGIVVDDPSYHGIAAPGGAPYPSTLPPAPANRWQHVIATFENNENCPVFLNGGALRAGGVTDTRLVQSQDGDDAMSIGGVSDGRSAYNSNAEIGEVRVYTRRLTPDEARQRFDLRCSNYQVCSAPAPGGR